MSNEANYIYLVIGMSVVTYISRMIPAVVLSKRNIPEIFIKFLSYIPVTVLSALFFPSILVVDNKINISTSNTLLITSLLTFPLAYKTKNMFLTVIVGMIIIALLNKFIY
ncbi:MAG: AzlD domain-containing protein [Thermovenabulum sp.]|uniref:AzlD domain-containing protein n=1 Tax=Thermovenabulum sp. TaxID=3100335 RepID=UPI003C79BF4E